MTRTTLPIAVALIAALTLPAAARAAVVQATFNDLSTGQLATQSGGTGFTGTWLGSTTLAVLAEDLVAPLSTNFALTQSGSARNVRGDNDPGRAVNRALATALTGTVWFSFLVRQEGSESRGGIELNPTLAGTGTTGYRIVGVGTTLRLIGGAADITVNGFFTLDQTTLVLGKLEINTIGNDILSIWSNPDVLNLGAPTHVLSTVNVITTSITAIGVESYRSGGTQGGTVDLLTLSNESDAYFQVTGVPAPAALPAGLALLTLAVARRRGIR